MKKSESTSHKTTSKHNDETLTIRREVRRVEESSNSAIVGGDPLKTTVAPVRLTSCDQMLIKFYLKHIEENLNELSKIEQILIDKLNLVVEINNSVASESGSPAPSKEANQALELAHKFAIGGHKLVFICDTLQRNINNLSLKQALIDTSNNLSAALKVYMIRLKLSPTTSSSAKPEGEAANKSGDSSSSSSTMFKNLILNAISSVLTCADEFKSIILKYYFKSF